MFSFIKGVRERLSIIKEQVSQPSDVQAVEAAVYDLTTRVTQGLDKKLQISSYYPQAEGVTAAFERRKKELSDEKSRRALIDAQG